MRSMFAMALMTTVLLGGASPAAARELTAVTGAAQPLAVEPEAESDFDGDGFADVVVGAPFDDVNGQADAGVVHVFFGSASGLATAGSQVWHQDRANVADVAEKGDQFGRSVATGDVDGDGRADLLIGVPGEDLGGSTNQGGVNVLYGSPNGLVARAGQPFVFGANPDYEGAQIGFALATLDILADGALGRDGRADVALGMPGYQGRGTVLIISSAIFDGTSQIAAVAEPDFPPVDQGARLGSVLAAGDLGIAGRVLAVGAPLHDRPSFTGGTVDSGTVFLVRNGDDVIELWQGNQAGDTPEDGDRFGSALAIGDVDGGGHNDLIIGTPFEDLGAHANAGLVQVLRGEPSRSALPSVGSGNEGRVAGPSGEASSLDIHEDSPGVPGTPSAGDRFGASLVAADLGLAAGIDLAIGVPGDDVGSIAGGAVVVLYNDGDGFYPDVTQNDRWHQDRPSVPDMAESADEFGATLTAGNTDGDALGFSDLIIGIPREDIAGQTDAGALLTLDGEYEGLWAGANFLHQDRRGVGEAAQPGDRFGSALR